MKKISITMLLTITLLFSASVFSDPYRGEDYDRGFALVDVVLMRPLGLALTVVGTGVFIALSPLTALAQISPPHDAFKKVADILIIAPGTYTFNRPLGDTSIIHFPEPEEAI